MGDFVFNQGLGSVAEWARDAADAGTDGQLEMRAFVTATADGTLKDMDDVAEVEADAGTAEATNSGYSKKILDDTSSIIVTVNDTLDRVEVDIPDQTFASISAGDNWTDIMIAYDRDSTGGTDADILPATWHDFAVTPDGSDITVEVADFFRAS